jgi:poly(A) polymerase
MAFNLKYFENFKKHIILPSKSALKDLKSKTKNIVSAKSFKSDPLRMLRAFRFVAELHFKLSKETLRQIRQNAKLISKAAPERIKNEFLAILSVKKSVVLTSEMDKCGLLAELFGEIKKMKKTCKKYYYHPGGLFQHSFETMASAENILNNLKKYFPASHVDMQNHFETSGSFSENVTRIGLLKFTALFHDNAKPETATFKNGKMRFFCHQNRGAEKMKSIMFSAKFSKKDIEYVTSLIKHHMRLSTLTRNNIVTKKAMLKLFGDIGDKMPDLVVLSMSDWHSYKTLKVSSPKDLKIQEKSVEEILKYYYELKNAKPLPKIIDGNIIMQKFNLQPGPWIGYLLQIVVKAHQNGEVSNTDEALKLVSLKLAQVKKKHRI